MSAVQHEVIPAAEVEKAREERRSLVAKLATRFGIDPKLMLPTLKATAFRLRDGEVTNEQMVALLVVADQYGLNPWTKEIYAFPDKNGAVIPVVGLDGWSRIINEHPQFDGMDFTASENIVTLEHAKPCPEWIECTMHRKDRSHPIKVSEYLDEVYRAPYIKNGNPIMGPWQTHTKRFLRHKSIIQCARLAFGFVGIFDEDEAVRIAESPMIDVTPAKDEQSAGGKIGPKKMRQIVEAILKAVEKEDTTGFLEVRDELENEEWLQVWSTLRSWERTAIKKFEAEARAMSCGMNLDGWCKTLLQNEKTLEGIEAAWTKIKAAYEANDIDEVPNEVHAFYAERKESMQ